MVGCALSVIYREPLASAVMSLQNACELGNETLRFPTPVLRSKPFNALPVSLPVAGPPNALKSFEQAQSVPDASSAKTPKIEREPNAPGWMNTVLSAVRGLTRTIPPSPSRPTKRAPSEVDVMLSGKAFSPGTGIDSTCWVGAGAAGLSANARMASWRRERCSASARVHMGLSRSNFQSESKVLNPKDFDSCSSGDGSPMVGYRQIHRAESADHIGWSATELPAAILRSIDGGGFLPTAYGKAWSSYCGADGSIRTQCACRTRGRASADPG